jgi:hypothetical protein
MDKKVKLANQKKESRDIVKTIIDFGVTEEQKLDIIYFLSLTLESNDKMKKICNLVDRFREQIGQDEVKQKEKTNKIILD